MWKYFVLISCLLCGCVAAAFADALRIPACTAYLQPDTESMPVSKESGITDWKDGRQKIAWYGYFPEAGPIRALVVLHLPVGERAVLRLRCGAASGQARVAGGSETVTADFGTLKIAVPGYHQFTLEGRAKSGATFGDVHTLLLDGPAAKNAHFNLDERRNAASVHLGYPVPKETKITAFYNEVTVRETPIYSYYMACGWQRGYFGIQVNSPTERRIIFSVWDSGSEAIDRNKVSPDDQVQLLAKGYGVFADSFGNEGTGGHSHRVYAWQKNVTYRFLVTAQPDGTHTIYSGYFFFPETKHWSLIARFRAPKDGGLLHGLYSFNENFGGANGNLRRLAEFGNQWIMTDAGHWQEITTARFTHDATGKANRRDYGAGVVKGRFFLSNGGFVGLPVKYGDTFQRPAGGIPPKELLLSLPPFSGSP